MIADSEATCCSDFQQNSCTFAITSPSPSPFLFTKLFIPIGVLTHKNSFVLKKSYTKVFNRKESNFDLDTCKGTEPKLIFFFSGKNFQWSGVPIKLLTQKKYLFYIVANT